MKIKNNISTEIEISISQWGKEGNTSYFTIKPNEQDSWSRSDNRGFVMSVKRNDTESSYFIRHDSNVEITDEKVKDRGNRINSLR